MKASASPLIDEFCDALWLEDGLSRKTLDAYRRVPRQNRIRVDATLCMDIPKLPRT